MIFRFSGTLLRFVNFQKEIDVEGKTLSDGLVALVAKEPQLKPVLYDGSGAVRSTHRLAPLKE